MSPRADSVREIFASVAHGYDRANDWMTFGLAHAWRNKLVRWSEAKPGDRVIDGATGTGDLAIAFAKVVGPSGSVTGFDFCSEMLQLAPGKAQSNVVNITFEFGDAMKLQYKNAQFDVASMAYGIRNVEDPSQGLRELARVVKPGGRVMILETGATARPFINWLVRAHCRFVVPLLGGWFTGNRGAYQYLNRTSSQFPCRDRFLELMNDTGCFSHTEFRSLMGGASYMYKGVVNVPGSNR